MDRTDLLYATLRQIAAQGLPCPGNEELAAVLGFKDVGTVTRHLAKLEHAGVIRREVFGVHRIITICESGQQTADTRRPIEPPKARPARSVADIASIVAEVAMLPLEDILSRSRHKIVIRPRALIYHFAHEAGWTWSDISRVVKRDHSTIIHAVGQVEDWLKRDPLLQRLFQRTAEALAGAPARVGVELPPIPPATPMRRAKGRAAPLELPPSKALRPVDYDPESHSEVSAIIGLRRGSAALLAAIRANHPDRVAA